MKLSKGKITVLKAGPYTSVQDEGRFGYAAFGIPTAGFMDSTSAGIANLLLGNPVTAPCFEIFAGGVIFQVEQPCLVASAGAETELRVGKRVFHIHQPIPLKAGETLEIPPFRSGQWLYLSLTGDIKVPERFGSQSFYFPITSQSRFRNGDEVDMVFNKPRYSPSNSRVGIRDWRLFGNLSAFPGPDFCRLSLSNQQALTQRSFTVSPIQNRMGIQLAELLENDLPGILSSPVFPGTVQLTPSGTLIVLMRDSQVTGGYPRILQLTDASISLLSQKRPGESVKFSLLSQRQVI